MKATGHPKYFEATVTCACGNTFTTGSTKQSITVDICSKCHPFFTGEMRFLDTMGRVEKFQQKMAAAPKGGTLLSKKARKALKKQEEEKEEASKPKNLKEMFDRVRSEAN